MNRSLKIRNNTLKIQQRIRVQRKNTEMKKINDGKAIVGGLLIGAVLGYAIAKIAEKLEIKKWQNPKKKQ